MKDIRYKLILNGMILMQISLLSCKKFVDLPPPQTQAEVSKVFATDATATSAVVGLYYQMTASNLSFANGAITIYGGLSADEFININPNSTYDPFRENTLLPVNTTVNSSFWSNAYKNIYQTNAVLEGLAQSPSLSLAIKVRLRGEMLFTRALNYFYLVNFFGDVPLIVSTDYRENSSVGRTAAKTVGQQIKADLTEARQLLADSYASTGNLRPNQMAASALLARFYLYEKDWSNAEKSATEVIGAGYQLESDPNQAFAATSTETILQFSRANFNTAEGFVFIAPNAAAKPTFALSSYLLNAFESGDKRQTAWLKTNIVGGVSYTYPFKYKVRSSPAISEYYVVLRLAEVYLIRAEARAQQQKTNEALNDLNIIRSRAGVTYISSNSQSAILGAIMKERQTELFAEWGHRWLDLKRTGRANEVLGAIKVNSWQSSDTFYPIPFDQIKLNPFLTQNQGY